MRNRSPVPSQSDRVSLVADAQEVPSRTASEAANTRTYRLISYSGAGTETR